MAKATLAASCGRSSPDPRDEVQSIGLQTITEIYVRACRDYGARSSA